MNLYKLFDEYNEKYFEGKLKVKKIYIVPSLRYKAVWGLCTGDNEVHISPDVFKVKGKLEETLYHEMCHLIHKNHGKQFKKLLSYLRYEETV